jgi:hypothetical protein
MLQLSDASLAVLVRAAREVSWRKRGRWLRELAERIDPPPNSAPAQNMARSPTAKRQAKARERRRCKTRCYRIELSDAAVEGLIQMWISDGKISEEQALRLDRVGIERELARGIEVQGAQWSR